MTQHGGSSICVDEESRAQAPLSAIELNLLNQLLKGYSVSEIASKSGYSDILVTSALRSIQTKTGANNLVRATVSLIRSGVIDIK